MYDAEHDAAGLPVVPDAAAKRRSVLVLSAKDRPIIAGQDFVAAHGVKTVFGFGGAYMLERSFAVIIVFARETVSREQVRAFAGLASLFKAATLSLVAAPPAGRAWQCHPSRAHGRARGVV